MIYSFINDASYGGVFLFLAFLIAALSILLFALHFLDQETTAQHTMDIERADEEEESEGEEDEEEGE